MEIRHFLSSHSLFRITFGSILLLSSLTIISSCLFHGSCERAVSGSILTNDTTSIGLKVVLKTTDRGGERQQFHDTLTVEKNGHYGLSKRRYAVNDCNNGDCREATPNSIQIIVINSTNAEILKDTIIKCPDLTYNGNDIELPTLTIKQ
jgi:hypothetical protein